LSMTMQMAEASSLPSANLAHNSSSVTTLAGP
jgi:hypothetical protein